MPWLLEERGEATAAVAVVENDALPAGMQGATWTDAGKPCDSSTPPNAAGCAMRVLCKAREGWYTVCITTVEKTLFASGGEAP
jgi:hypothetical protein